MMLSEDTSFPKSIHKAKGLRSLLIHTRDPSFGAALPDLFKQLTCIRSLNLSESSIKEIPNDIGKLIHLRHLNLAFCGVLESLPETTCDLCNLQSLDVTWCRSLKELAKAIGKLIKLRHLRIDGSGVAFIPKGIERITCLRTLDVFTVCGGGDNESKAANLRELKNLNHIGGSLIISNLGRGKEDASDAAEAQLKNKKRLLGLELYFDREKTELQANEGSLIEGLQPPSYLEYLTISSYGGLELPNWMMTLTRLQSLKLDHCENVEVLPPLGRLPNLESLVLRSLKVRRLHAGFLGIEKDENASINEGEIARVTAFPKLEKLIIWNLKEVEEWDGIGRRVREEDANTTSIISIMPQLRELIIDTCPLLRALPDYVLAAPLQLRHLYGSKSVGPTGINSLGFEDTKELLQSGFRFGSESINCLLWSLRGGFHSMFGMGPDFGVLVRKSRKQAEQYHRLYKEPIPVRQLVRETAAVMQEFTSPVVLADFLCNLDLTFNFQIS
ncbi:disease resistance protein RGA3 [Populus alba x Populus x berolinensis]|nr:disease resistance protein RGA3 [Populus alba x Populus x berolinensis]